MRDWRHGGSVFLYAFDLIELNGDDLRRDPLAVRKATTMTTARSSSSMPASSGLRESFQSGGIHAIVRAAPHIG